MTRGGRSKSREVSERRCIATGESQPRAGLIRFAIGPENDVVPDLAERLPGRGMWVAAEKSALDRAATKGLFARAAKASVAVPEGLVDQVEALLVKRISDHLALARKAGQAVAGKEKVKSWLEMETAVLLLQASDGSERERRSLRPPPGSNTLWTDLTAQELGMAFGRTRVIHAAVCLGGLADSVSYDCARLHGIRGTLRPSTRSKRTGDRPRRERNGKI